MFCLHNAYLRLWRLFEIELLFEEILDQIEAADIQRGGEAAPVARCAVGMCGEVACTEVGMQLQPVARQLEQHGATEVGALGNI